MRVFMNRPIAILFKLAMILLLSPLYTHAQIPEETPALSIPFFLSDSAQHKNIWTITGILRNEHDEPYGFSFSLYRQANTFQVQASIIDLNQKKLIWQQSASLNNTEPNLSIERVGPFFWHFSPINSSLIIGYENNNQQIFNLKLDLIEPTKITPTSSLTKNLKLKQFWSGTINGHLKINDNEQFVTSHGMWLQQIWQTAIDIEQHAFQEILCKFQDGSALFAIQVHEKDALRAALAGRFNAQGEKKAISQFLNLSIPLNPDFDILLAKPSENLHLTLLNQMPYEKIMYSVLEPNVQTGICVFQTNPWSSLNNIKPILKTKTNFLEKTIALSKKPFKIPLKLRNKFTS
jgi:hypothetical protein